MRKFVDTLDSQDTDSVIFQIIAPVQIRRKLLDMSHDIPESGHHLGIHKTRDRLTKHFYWPSIVQDVKDYARTCHICQKLNKGKYNEIAPLHSLPIRVNPFDRLALW